MNIGTWNVQGLSRKTNEIISELKHLNIDIAVLTETKKKGQGSENLGYYDHFYSGIERDKRAQQGVSILIQKKLRRFISSWEAINERIIKMNLNIRGYKITLLGVYAINDDAPVAKKNELFERLHREITKIGNSRELILLGDMNARTGRKSKDDTIGQFGEDITNDNGTRLITMAEQNELRVLNGFFQHRHIHKYTWTQQSRNLQSIIDYVIIRRKSKLKIQDVRVQRGPTCGSDHHLLRSKILFNHKGNETETQTNLKPEHPKEVKYNLLSLNQESVKTLYRNRLDQKLQDANFNTIEEYHHHIKKCLHAAAEEALGRKEKTTRRKPYWWDQEIEQCIQEKRQLYLTYLNTKSNNDKTKYKEAQRTVRTKITQKKNESWEVNCSRINNYLGGSRNSESWKFLKALRQDRKREIISPITLNKWDQYFSNLLTEDRINFKDQALDTNTNIQTSASPIRIRIGEVRKICKALKNGKSPGPGNIAPELIKYGTENLYRHLTTLFQKCINENIVPEEWKTSYMSTIHKKGSKDNPDNYRGIAVLSSISRIYGKLLTKIIENEYSCQEAEEQAGFRAGRSTMDHLFTISQIIEKKTAYNQELHLLFIDLKKAYDNIPHSKLWEALELTNINVNIIKVIKSLYENSTTKVKAGDTLSEGFRVTKGLKQGCSMSPTLFKIYLEQALKTWKKKCKLMGIPLNDTTLYTLSFADDQIVLAQEYDDLEYMTRKLNEEYTKWGLEINLSKTEYMCIGGAQQDLILADQQETIKRCEKYKYLGMYITRDGRMDEAIKERNTQGRKAISLLNGVLWDKNVSKENKHRIYNSIVKSITTYSSDVWQLKERSIGMLEATEMDFWRRSAGKSRLEKIRNEQIKEIMKVTHSIIDDIRINQLKWYGHVQRMTADRLPKQALQWTPQGRRKRGRPRKSWREGIDKDMRMKELGEDLWMDRDLWRMGIGRRKTL